MEQHHKNILVITALLCFLTTALSVVAMALVVIK
jgi:hypothetical protein